MRLDFHLINLEVEIRAMVTTCGNFTCPGQYKGELVGTGTSALPLSTGASTTGGAGGADPVEEASASPPLPLGGPLETGSYCDRDNVEG